MTFNDSFFAINHKSLGGWVLYRNGQEMAKFFTSKKEAKGFAENFCKLNNYFFIWK